MTTAYAPHPWDSFGPPPPLGPATYEDTERVVEVKRLTAAVEGLLRRAVEYDERAQDLEDEADDERSQASGLRAEAQDLIESDLRPLDARAADALGPKVDG